MFKCYPDQLILQISHQLKISGLGLLRHWATTALQLLLLMNRGTDTALWKDLPVPIRAQFDSMPKQAVKGEPRLLMREEEKYCLQDKRMASTVIRSYLNDAGISVSSKTIRRLADVRLRGKVNLRKVVEESLSRKEDFQMLRKELHQKRFKVTSVPQDTLRPVKKIQARKFPRAICRSSKDNKTTIT
ncbi:hypothetical protein TNCV_3802981 [Trichonephila clavipes]|nr:hypothetical protein TNCV_3802981 [Trichonephila clavipes]